VWDEYLSKVLACSVKLPETIKRAEMYQESIVKLTVPNIRHPGEYCNLSLSTPVTFPSSSITMKAVPVH
jgi:hypothetical protein